MATPSKQSTSTGNEPPQKQANLQACISTGQKMKSLSLAEIREMRGLTQIEISRRMKVEQANISRVESRGDMRISTLSDYLEAAGGKLELFAKFGHDVVAIRIEETRGTKLRRRPIVIPLPDLDADTD